MKASEARKIATAGQAKIKERVIEAIRHAAENRKMEIRDAFYDLEIDSNDQEWVVRWLREEGYEVTAIPGNLCNQYIISWAE